MLELQRASAGSGKTYTLAKKFIWYLITIPDSGRRRLRNRAELSDSLGHILAVTFTNKATNEMQQRIVENLYALGFPTPGKTPDYQIDFLKELNSEAAPEEKVTDTELRQTCREAVTMLLNNYSDFQVSTIDSFFQQVLRTFAYESDLSDSYRIELDSAFLSAMAIDALLEDINTGNDRSGASYWISVLMGRVRESGGKWNIFAKSRAGNNPYNQLLESVKRLENEEFKEKRKKLDEYFASDADLIAIFEDMRERYDPLPQDSFKAMTDIADELDAETKRVRREGVQVDETELKQCRSRVSAVRGFRPEGKPKLSDLTIPGYKTATAAYQDRKKKLDTAAYEKLEEINLWLDEAFEKWKSVLGGREYRHWNLYRCNIPFLGLLRALIDKRDEYLRESNAVELGETNSILSSIIGKEDAPFIYERIGTRLNHFLIDEFQDTSRLQWINLNPLLHESIGRGNENLIIGDAKQSIYRFRNADSSLISETVPAEFGLPDAAADSDPAKNTNWRSDLHIVLFNNSFFDFLTSELNRLVGVEADPSRRDHCRDYANVVQTPHKREDAGYVEVRIESIKKGENWSRKVLEKLPAMVTDLLSRGFRMRDIAVLVNRNDEGEAVIEQLTAHNSAGIGPRIEFVSEQSLKLTSSVAIALVVSVLETISRGADPEIRKEGRSKGGVADWGDIACNFRFYALRHPELSTQECLDEFFRTGGDNDAIGEMLSRMQAVSLPALVESIAAEFVEKEIRDSEAAFLAAFQDIVLEYCDSRPSDIASFLKWWNERKDKISICSPDDMDAISVMTIHKSKGLEFPVVIVPFADSTFKDTPGKIPEWRWVKPEVLVSDKGPLPPFIPVETSGILESTAHERVLAEYYDLRKADYLNTIYVAFTRAVCELYIFAKPGSEKSPDPCSISYLLRRFFEEGSGANDEDIKMVDSKLISVDEEILRYGNPYVRYVPRKKKENDADGEKDTEQSSSADKTETIITEYRTNPTPDFLIYKESDLPSVKDIEDYDPEEDDTDPRSEGNLLHEIMESVEIPEDIARAARRLVINGSVSKRQAEEMAALLEEAVSRPEVAEWFSGTMRVVTERSLLRAGKKVRRPDRVMITDNGEVVVVDYKFGESSKSSGKYVSQVRGYVNALKDTGRYRSVRGYLWYVRRNRLEFVCD